MAYTSRPNIQDSTRDERLAYVRTRFTCISDCDQCGLCVLFRRQDPETALEDYIEGNTEFVEVMKRYR